LLDASTRSAPYPSVIPKRLRTTSRTTTVSPAARETVRAGAFVPSASGGRSRSVAVAGEAEGFESTTSLV
jgi:hypothetical protein